MNGFIQSLRQLGPVRLGALGIVALLTLGFFGYIGTRVAAPTYSLLYADLDLKDSAQITQRLDALGIPYEIRGDGSGILVPSDQVAKLRMTMAEAGLPRGGSVGYELFDKSEGLGTSSFVQNVNQLRALEGELARTIASISTVQAARVHLVLPRREVFQRDRQEPSAAIVLKLRGAERLGKGQVAAIRHLVAAAVPGLKPAQISVVDGEGNLLARGGEEAGFAGADADEARIAYENRLARTVEEMIERTVGPGKVRAEVRADMDFDRVTTSSEVYDPDGQVVRSTQTVTEQNDQSDGADQAVTVANNLPDAQKPSESAAGRTRSARSEETVNYEISKKVTSHVREGGVVRRLSVAVLVDGIWTLNKDGQRQWQPRPAEEMERIGALVRSAIGFDEKRGDRVEIVNLRFAGNEAVGTSSDDGLMLLGLDKNDLIRLVEGLALMLVGLLVVLVVVRPFLNRLAEAAPALAPAGAPLLPDGTPDVAGALPAPPGTALAPGAAPGAVEEEDPLIDISKVEGRVRKSSVKKIAEIVDKHPEETVAILRQWMYQQD
ncbi:MAG: flagellar M-ring protein FliF [Rhodospirillales bacterium]|nr:flagellar M-ring protein FliF [Rhodospirillales bacterium]